MGVSLNKGGNVSLSKEAPGLTAITVGLGWDVRTTTGTDFDLDASVLLCTEAGRVLSDRRIVFFNNIAGPAGSVLYEHETRKVLAETRPAPTMCVVKVSEGGVDRHLRSGRG